MTAIGIRCAYGRLFFLPMCLLVSMGLTQEAWAGLSVAPGIIEIIAARNDEAQGVCTVTNRGTEKNRVSVEPEDWRKGARGKRGGSVADWLTIKPASIELDPGQSGNFTYAIKVQPDAAGEYTAQIFFSESSGQGGTQIHTRVGAILYVAIRETMRLEAEISQLNVSAQGQSGSSFITAQVGVANTGNVHIRPTGDVKIFDLQGTLLCTTVLATGWGILPTESYTYQGSGKTAVLKTGKYKAVATIQYGTLYKQDKSFSKELYFEIGDNGNVVQPQSEKKP